MSLCGHEGRTAKACRRSCQLCLSCCAAKCGAGQTNTPTTDPDLPAVRPVKERRPHRKAECGTRPGYARHQQAGETACDPCKDANNTYAREHRKRIGTATEVQS